MTNKQLGNACPHGETALPCPLCDSVSGWLQTIEEFQDQIPANRIDVRYQPGDPRRLRLNDLFEKLAAIEHERWAAWQQYMHSRCSSWPDGTLTIPSELVRQWERQIATDYADLSESEKESDRDQVRRYWGLISDGALK